MAEKIEFKAGIRRMPPVLAIPAETPKAPPKKEKTPTYNFTLAQIEDIKRQAARDAVHSILDLTLGFPVMVMHDKHGWGHTRLDRFIDDVLDLYDSYEKGYLTLEDIRRVLQEEGGIRIEKKEIIRRYKR